jgi:dihydrolipoamide dehydrogenase
MERYDLVVIGAGPSGYAAAMRALDFNKKILLLEKSQLGGAGVTNGALSSKTWWELSREAATLKEHVNHFNIDQPEFNFFELKTEVERAVQERKSLLTHHIEVLNECSSYKDLLTFRNGSARLKSKNEVEITDGAGHTDVVWAENIILATGSRPRKLPDIPIDEKVILTSDGIGELEEFPKSMVILGAGVIGCEFATIFSSFGHTKVHLIDKGDRILPFEDEDVVKVIERNLEKAGVLIHRNSRLTSMEIADDWVKYILEYTDGREETFYVEKALVSVGRIPNYENLGLEEQGIEMDARGIKDSDTRTSVDNIYAVGDITADIALVNVGELEARHAVERMFGNPDRKIVYENISTIMFLNPVVAGVGLNETQAQAKGISYKVASLSYSCIPRAVAMRDTQGFIKLLVTNDEEMKILGMRVVGHHASSAIQAVALLISMNKGIDELAECVHPHPAIIEGIQEVVRMLLGKSMFKPMALTQYMSCKIWDGEYRDY